MKKYLSTVCCLLVSLTLLSVPVPAQAATRAEMIQQIELLTRLISVLQAQLKIQIEEEANENKNFRLYLDVKNISNPTTYKYKNGVIKAINGDRIAVGLKQGDMDDCSLKNPGKELRIRGPFLSSETDSEIIEIDMSFDSPSKLYKIGITCDKKSDTVRIDYTNLQEK